MKKMVLLLFFVLLPGHDLSAQSLFNSAGCGVGGNLLIGEKAAGSVKIAPNLGLFVIRHINSQWNLKVQIGFGQLGVKPAHSVFTVPVIPVEIVGMYSVLPGAKISPFLQTGFGIIGFTLSGAGPFFDAMAIGGFGFKLPISPTIDLLVSTDVRYTSGDDFNGKNGGLKDGYWNFQSGVAYKIDRGKQKYHRRMKTQKSEVLTNAGNYYDLQALQTRLDNLQTQLSKLELKIDQIKQLAGEHAGAINRFAMELTQFKNKVPGKGVLTVNEEENRK